MVPINLKQQQTPVETKIAPVLAVTKQLASTVSHAIWLERGKLLIQQGCYEDAIASLDTTLSLQPAEHRAWIYRGVALAYLECYEAALASFNNAIEQTPNNRSAWIFRGAALTYLNRPKEAHNSYRVALNLQQQGFAFSDSYPITWLPQPTTI
jgi:Flp pilus assembly protein TadD